MPSSVQPANVTINGGAIAYTVGTLDSAAATSATTLNTNRGITLGPSGGTINVNFQDMVTGSHNGSETAVVYIEWSDQGNGRSHAHGPWRRAYSTTGASIFDLGTTATYTGNTTVSNAVLEASSGASRLFSPLINMLPTNTTLVLVNSGVLNLDNAASNLQVAGLTGDATGEVTTNSQGATIVLTLGGSGLYSFPGTIGRPPSRENSARVRELYST